MEDLADRQLNRLLQDQAERALDALEVVKERLRTFLVVLNDPDLEWGRVKAALFDAADADDESQQEIGTLYTITTARVIVETQSE